MGSFNNGSYPGSSSFDNLLIQNLMGRLQLRPPYLGTNSLLSQSFDDLFQDDALSVEDSDEPLYDGGEGKGLLAREEAKLEKEIIRIVRSGAAQEILKPNSGQSVAVGSHNICVGYHQESGSEYRVWEWHGHIMLFDEENGYVPEYIYGNYFERIPVSRAPKEVEHGGRNAGEDEEKTKGSEISGLRELVGDDKDPINGSGRVLHRNSVNSRPAK